MARLADPILKRLGQSTARLTILM